MPLQAGSTLGAYRILNPIGAGGMGEVYLARDTTLHRDVAVKVLPEAIASQADRVARFSREAQLLASLNHPNIASIYGVEHSGRSLALVLEFVDGETLADRLKRGPMPLPDVLDVALQICRAIEAAHERGVIHRDLKPANVKLTTSGAVKVLDFGLAKALAQDAAPPQSMSQSPTLSLAATNAGVLLGTVGYMAPEQARGMTVDRRADIWAFGVVLFEMLSGRPVFEGQTIADTIANLLQRDPDWHQLPAHTPAALRTLVKRCLAKNPKDRLQAIGDARLVLEEMIANPSAQQPQAADNYPAWKKLLPWAVAPLFLAAGYFLRPAADVPEPSVSQFEVTLPAQLLAHNYREVTQLTPGPLDIPSSWTPDGRTLAFTRGLSATGGNTDIYVVSTDRPNEARPLIATSATEAFPEFSPNGKWLAYTSNESGRTELYVQPYPGPGGRVTVTGGGNVSEPAWSKNGNELFYRAGQAIMSVRYASGDDFVPERPVKLFDQPPLLGGTTVRATYDVAPDGRFLFGVAIAEGADERVRRIFPRNLRVVLNWSTAANRMLAAQ